MKEKLRELGLVKARNNHRLFTPNQKLWIVFNTGALASMVVGRYKGKGRWIKAWVHYPDKEEYGEDTDRGFFCKADADFIDYVKVTESFYQKIHKIGYGYYDGQF